MRYGFIGGVDFSARCLETLLASGVNVSAILCLDQSKFNSDFRDLEPIARHHGKPVRRFRKIADETEYLRAADLDVLFVLGLSQIITPEVLSTPKIGCIGSHPALLPRNRGRHPIVWAIANGLTESGVTLFWLDSGVDSGAIWKQASFPIAAEDGAGEVYEKVCALGTKLLAEGVQELESGRIQRHPQDHSRANYWRKRTVDDGCIDWRMSSKRIHDLVRALRRPYPGAHCRAGASEVKIWATKPIVVDGVSNLEPGKVLASHPLTIKTGDGAVQILEHEFQQIPQPGEYV